MSNTCKGEYIYYIDHYKGYNNGFCVDEFKEVLRRMGVNVVDEYYEGVTHFVYCIINTMPPTVTSSLEMYNQEVAHFNQEMDLHMQLLKNAVNSGKCVIPIEKRIAYAVTSFRLNYGNSIIACGCPKTTVSSPAIKNRSIIICDLTRHYKPVSLDICNYKPPQFYLDCPAGVSPFVLPSLWDQMAEDLNRKYHHLQEDLQARKEGRVLMNNWKEAYLKKNIKKKQMKTRTCEICRETFNSYLEHVATQRHISNINSSQYFEYLKKVFKKFLVTSWKCVLSDFNKFQKQKANHHNKQYMTILSLDSHINIQSLFYHDYEICYSPPLSSLSTELGDSYDGKSNEPASSTSGDNEFTILNQCFIQTNDSTIWLFPQFFTYTKGKAKSISRTFSTSSISSSTSFTPPLHSSSLHSHSKTRVKQKAVVPTPVYVQKALYPVPSDTIQSVPPQAWNYTPNEVYPNGTIQNIYPEMYQPQFIPSSVYPVISQDSLNPIQVCSPVYQPYTNEPPPFSMMQPTIISNEPQAVTFEPFNSYSPVVSIAYPSGVSNAMIQNYTPCEKMDAGHVPLVGSGNTPVMVSTLKEKTVNSEVVEIVPTNSSSVAGIISPVSDLLPYAAPCGDNTNDLIKK